MQAHGGQTPPIDRTAHSPKSEIATLTAMRGIAAISVAGHNFLNPADLWQGATADHLTRWLDQGHLFVDFFFILRFLSLHRICIRYIRYRA